MAMNFLSAEGRCVPGIQFSASTLLRIGVALLGVRITLAQITALGAWPIAMVVASVALTIGFGIVLARALGYRNRFGVLTGGAVAICGASAAMAIAAVMPAHADDKVKERATIFTVIGVSTLSTLAMVLYPMIVGLLGLGSEHAGIFLGGTIHDVAQVVGAGYSMGKDTGDVATIVKLLRVAMLLPVILVITLSYRKLHLRRTGGCEEAAAAAVVRGGLCGARGHQQCRADSRRPAAGAADAVDLAAGGVDGGHRHEVAPEGVCDGGLQADRADGQRDRVPGAAGGRVPVPDALIGQNGHVSEVRS